MTEEERPDAKANATDSRDAAWQEAEAVIQKLDAIISHVETWPPAEDGFLDDLRAVRAHIDSFGVAWREVEAVLPEGRDLSLGSNRHTGSPYYFAYATGQTEGDEIGAAGPTPAAALRVLAARLAEEPHDA